MSLLSHVFSIISLVSTFSADEMRTDSWIGWNHETVPLSVFLSFIPLSLVEDPLFRLSLVFGRIGFRLSQDEYDYQKFYEVIKRTPFEEWKVNIDLQS